jgi:hypothetical protein
MKTRCFYSQTIEAQSRDPISALPILLTDLPPQLPTYSHIPFIFISSDYNIQLLILLSI